MMTQWARIEDDLFTSAPGSDAMGKAGAPVKSVGLKKEAGTLTPAEDRLNAVDISAETAPDET